ncbi:MAG: hypothetical protein HYX41_02330 [Bdellovibrio sp.]|nr:hypothetical protein [Bdellovibrio sp.]
MSIFKSTVHRNSFRGFLGVALLAGVLFSFQDAYAYIPPSGFILKTWIGRHSANKLVRVRSKVTLFKEGKPTDLHFKETAFFGPSVSFFKGIAQDESGRKLQSLEKSAASASAFTQLVLGTDVNQVGLALKEKGIPIRLEQDLLTLLTEEERIKAEDESMSRWKNTIAWVVGQGAQVWFQKDGFQPLRLLMPSEGLGEEVEIQFDEIGTTFYYPRVVTVLKKKSGEILFESRLIEISNISESAVPASLFNQPVTEPENLDAQKNFQALLIFAKQYFDVLR